MKNDFYKIKSIFTEKSNNSFLLNLEILNQNY